MPSMLPIEGSSTPAPPYSRSRSSSLTSADAPSRHPAYRSPSRSADLDKFNGDYPKLSANVTAPTVPPADDASATLASSFQLSSPTTVNTAHSSVMSLAMTTTSSTSLDTSDDHTEVFSYRRASPPVEYVRTEESRLSKLNNLSLGGPINNSAPMLPGMKSATLPTRPNVSRAATAPFPMGGNSDIRFLVLTHDYDPRDIAFNSDGNMIGASLSVLIEKMIPHDGPVEPGFASTFFSTFRLFTHPRSVVVEVKKRYSQPPPQNASFGERELAIWRERKVVPIRLRVYNFFKTWLELHWRPNEDVCILDALEDFAQHTLTPTLPAMGPRLLDLIHRRQTGPPSMASHHSVKRSSSSERIRFSPTTLSQPPTPIISKTVNSSLQKGKAVDLVDFDTLELARQLTVAESKLFRAVDPEQLISHGKLRLTSEAPELKMLSTVSNQITGWVADSILNEHDGKKRATLLKFYIKLADVSGVDFCMGSVLIRQRCLALDNFSSCFALVAGLNSSIILRLKKTWDVGSQPSALHRSDLTGNRVKVSLNDGSLARSD